MANVTSVAGDCFNAIAKAQGFYNYVSIYNYDNNATQFPNPNQVEEGSTVKVPDKQMKAFDLVLDGQKSFKIVRKKTQLKIKICKGDATQTPGITKAKLELGAKKAADTNGTLNLDDIDPSLVAGTLTITLANPPAYAAPPATSTGVANQYPPPIVTADFDDPKTVWPKNGDTITWNLLVGHLEPHTVTRGVLQRLQNLGFTCPVQKAEDDATRRAVRTYRRFVEGKVSPADTDAVADIQNHIKSRHDD